MESSSTASRLLSRESSAGNPSFRSVLYYGVASVAVPFLWESQPGTPKHADAAAAALPPLTPPPSYFCSHTHGRSKKKKKTNKAISKSTFIQSMLLLPNHRKAPASFSSSSSSSSYDHEDSDDGSPTSTLCIGLCGRRPMKGPLLAP